MKLFAVKTLRAQLLHHFRLQNTFRRRFQILASNAFLLENLESLLEDPNLGFLRLQKSARLVGRPNVSIVFKFFLLKFKAR